MVGRKKKSYISGGQQNKGAYLNKKKETRRRVIEATRAIWGKKCRELTHIYEVWVKSD